MNETALLQLIHAKGIGSKTIVDIFRTCKENGFTIEEFVSLPLNNIVQLNGLKHEIAQEIKKVRDNAQRIAEELYRQSISIITMDMVEYPKTLLNVLKQDAPPYLFAKGNLSLLERKGVGFCGSRKASEKGINIAHDTSHFLSEKGINVVSGYATGVDTAAHTAALKSRGTTTIILPDGIFNFKFKNSLREYISDNNYIIVSEFPPKLSWKAHNAMKRNKTICGLSKAVILIESGLTGGTFAAGKTALKLKLPLFVVEYSKPGESAAGNSYFLKRGAKALRKTREGKPNLKNVLKIFEEIDIPDNKEGLQRKLF